jgi:flagellar hook protein FlgE
MIDFGTPLAGMQRAEGQLNATAARIAQTAGPQADSVDLSSAAVNLIQAKYSFAANAKVAALTDEMTKTALNLIG